MGKKKSKTNAKTKTTEQLLAALGTADEQTKRQFNNALSVAIEANKLESRLNELLARRTQLDREIDGVRQALAALRGQPAPPTRSKGTGQRMNRYVAKVQRQQAGGEMVNHMHRHYGRQREWTRGELEVVIDPDMKYHFEKIIAEWNDAHPGNRIEDNGKGGNLRRYHVVERPT